MSRRARDCAGRGRRSNSRRRHDASSSARKKPLFGRAITRSTMAIAPGKTLRHWRASSASRCRASATSRKCRAWRRRRSTRDWIGGRCCARRSPGQGRGRGSKAVVPLPRGRKYPARTATGCPITWPTRRTMTRLRDCQSGSPGFASTTGSSGRERRRARHTAWCARHASGGR
jgi:hypothetical protein